jgi:hypothetical protein
LDEIIEEYKRGPSEEPKQLPSGPGFLK